MIFEDSYNKKYLKTKLKKMTIKIIDSLTLISEYLRYVNLWDMNTIAQFIEPIILNIFCNTDQLHNFMLTYYKLQI